MTLLTPTKVRIYFESGKESGEKLGLPSEWESRSTGQIDPPKSLPIGKEDGLCPATLLSNPHFPDASIRIPHNIKSFL